VSASSLMSAQCLPNSVPKPERALASPQVDRWGGQDLNLRPTDYESVGAPQVRTPHRLRPGTIRHPSTGHPRLHPKRRAAQCPRAPNLGAGRSDRRVPREAGPSAGFRSTYMRDRRTDPGDVLPWTRLPPGVDSRFQDLRVRATTREIQSSTHNSRGAAREALA